MGGRRITACLLLALWFLTTGSSCSLTVHNGNFTGSSSGAVAGVGIIVFLIGGGIYCIANSDDCFLDEEALREQAEVTAAAQSVFVEGLRRQRAGDPMGLPLICVAAQAGSAQAQYSYGSQLLRQGTAYRNEARTWLRLAKAQGNREADLLLRTSGQLRQEGTASQSAGSARPWDSVTCPAVGPFPPFDLESS